VIRDFSAVPHGLLHFLDDRLAVPFRAHGHYITIEWTLKISDEKFDTSMICRFLVVVLVGMLAGRFLGALISLTFVSCLLYTALHF
jgi:hypothetical protein